MQNQAQERSWWCPSAAHWAAHLPSSYPLTGRGEGVRLLPLSPDSEQGSQWTITERQPEGCVLGDQAAPVQPGDLG